MLVYLGILYKVVLFFIGIGLLTRFIIRKAEEI